MLLESSQFVTGLGHIPTDWRVKTADEISLKITKGTTPPKEDIVEHREIPFLRVNNLGFNGVLDQKSDFIFVSRNAHEGFLARSKAYPGDILMNIVGPPLGKVSLLGNDFAEYNMNQAIVIYRLQDDVIYRNYFLAYLLSDIAQQWLQSRSKKTSGQQNLTIELCKGLPVPIPAFVEQKKIAQILSTWDQAIATERLLDLARQQKKALMQQLLTGKKRFPGFEGEWTNCRLKEICELGSGYSAPQDPKYFSDLGYDFLRVSDIGASNERNAPISRDKINEAAVNDFRMRQVKAGSTIFTKSGASLLLNQRAQLTADTFIVSHLGFATPKAVTDSNFLYYLFCSIDFSSLASGTSLPALQLAVLGNVIVHIPDTKEQEKIAAALASADMEIENLQSQLDGLKQEKKALMQQLLTGKVRVKVMENHE